MPSVVLLFLQLQQAPMSSLQVPSLTLTSEREKATSNFSTLRPHDLPNPAEEASLAFAFPSAADALRMTSSIVKSRRHGLALRYQSPDLQRTAYISFACFVRRMSSCTLLV